MKLSLLFALLLPLSTLAQLPSAEFSEAMELLTGSDPVAAKAKIDALEQAYPGNGQVLFLQGFYAFRADDQTAAMTLYSKAIQAEPDFSMGYAARSQLFVSRGLFDRAIADLSKAIELEPERGDFVYSRLECYVANDQASLALADAERLIALEPDGIGAYLDAANLATDLGDLPRAQGYFDQAYRQTTIPRFVTDAVCGQWHLKRNDFENARQKYAASLAAGEAQFDHEDLNNAGVANYKTAHYDEAIRLFRKGIALEPSFMALHNNLGSVYIDREDWTSLKACSQDALRQNSDDAMSNMLMAVALSRLGDGAEAAVYETRAKQLEAEAH